MFNSKEKMKILDMKQVETESHSLWNLYLKKEY